MVPHTEMFIAFNEAFDDSALHSLLFSLISTKADAKIPSFDRTVKHGLVNFYRNRESKHFSIVLSTADQLLRMSEIPALLSCL